MSRLIGQNNKLYIRAYQDHEDFLPNPRAHDTTTITWSWGGDEADITLSNLSPHTQYLLNQGRLAIGLIIERTINFQWRISVEDPSSYIEKWYNHYVARTFHPRWMLISDTVTRINGSSVQDYILHVGEIKDIIPSGARLNVMAEWSNEHHNPDRPYFWTRIKVILMTAPPAGQPLYPGLNCRGYKTSDPITVGLFNEELQ